MSAYCYKAVFVAPEGDTEGRLKLYFQPKKIEGIFGLIAQNAKGQAKFVITLGNQTTDQSAQFVNQTIDEINCYTFSMQKLGATAPVFDAETGRSIGRRTVATWLNEDEAFDIERQRFADRLAAGEYTYTRPTTEEE